ALTNRFLRLSRPALRPEEPARRQVCALGYDPADVRHIVLTHLDLAHAGGIRDFPHASVHVLADEHQAAMHPRGSNEKGRYRQAQWAHGPRWKLYDKSTKDS